MDGARPRAAQGRLPHFAVRVACRPDRRVGLYELEVEPGTLGDPDALREIAAAVRAPLGAIPLLLDPAAGALAQLPERKAGAHTLVAVDENGGDPRPAARRLRAAGYGLIAAFPVTPPDVGVPVEGRRVALAQLAGLASDPAPLLVTGADRSGDRDRAIAAGAEFVSGEWLLQTADRRDQLARDRVVSQLKLAAGALDLAEVRDLEGFVSDSPGLAVMLLRYLNSAFFSLPSRVGSIGQAVTLLGVAETRRWLMTAALLARGQQLGALNELALTRAALQRSVRRARARPARASVLRGPAQLRGRDDRPADGRPARHAAAQRTDRGRPVRA